jgi:N-acetylmuramoyl-L-alanine amidase
MNIVYSGLQVQPTPVRPNEQLKKRRLASHSTRTDVYVCTLVLLCALCTFGGFPVHAQDASERKTAVQQQFARAEGLREALEAKPERERSLQEYEQVTAAYRRVYLITPNAAEVPTAIKQVGDLYNRMGDQFDAKYFRSALASYEFLVRDYPASRYVPDAQLAIAALQRGPLGEPDAARQAYEDFLQQHPRSARAGEARTALAEMAAAGKKAAAAATAAPVTAAAAKPPVKSAVPGNAPATPPAAATPASTATAIASAAAPAAKSTPAAALASAPTPAATDSNGSPSELGQVRVWNADSYTRVIIDLGGQAKYQAARISAPDRIYFDIENAHLNARLASEPVEIPSNGYLKSVRIAQNRANVVRVVLEVDKVKDYSVFELANPDRLVVDVYGTEQEGTAPATVTVVPTTPTAPAGKDPAGSRTASATKPVTPASSPATAAKGATKPSLAASAAPPTVREAKAAGTVPGAKSPAVTPATEDAATQAPLLSAKRTVAAMTPATPAQPTRAGERSLTRVLGLKVGRIVIDAGHGGHDTGTIGPTGLMEKDLCLDVSLRLGRIIQERLPLAEVTYTRSDDSFVALEQRTAIANDARSDLLISVHANSSDDHKVRGIETYYLNFNAAPAAMEVAARENAFAQGGVHQLQELVQKIARNEKIEESRDLAANIQDSLTKQTNANARNRGVRKAPFVVLIGANMPSVLTEISFLSNPADEQWLKKPENRQRVAEGIYHGIESYLKSTNSFAGNLRPGAPGASSQIGQ